MSPTINFTAEHESDQKLPFLDTWTFRGPQNFDFTVYRKPTHSNSFLHFYSSNPRAVKRSVVFGMFLRAYRLCTTDAFLKDEIYFIEKTFRKLAYPDHFVSKVHRDVRRKHFQSDFIPREQIFKPSIKLPFNKYCNKIVSPILRSHGAKVYHASNNTIKSRLVNNAPPKQGGVYFIPCKECPKVYIGQTGRSLQIRLREHQSYVRRRMHEKAVFKHMFDTNHALDWGNSKFIYRSSNEKQRLVVESTLIQHLPNFNLMQGTSSVNASTRELILKCNKFILNNLPQQTINSIV